MGFFTRRIRVGGTPIAGPVRQRRAAAGVPMHPVARLWVKTDFLYDTKPIREPVCLCARRMDLSWKRQNVLIRVDAEEQDAFKQENGPCPELGRLA